MLRGTATSRAILSGRLIATPIALSSSGGPDLAQVQVDSRFVVDCWIMNLTGVARIGAAQVVLLLFLSLISSCQGGTPVTLRMSWTLGNTHYGPNLVSLQSKCAKPINFCHRTS